VLDVACEEALAHIIFLQEIFLQSIHGHPEQEKIWRKILGAP